MSKETEQIEARLCAYIDGELDEAARKEIERQLASDPRHRQLLNDLIRVRDLVADLPRENAPPEIEETINHHLERSLLLDETPGAGAPLRINRWPQIVSTAAILLLAIGLGIVVWLVIRPPRENPSGVSMSPPIVHPPGATMDQIPSTHPVNEAVPPPQAPRMMSRGIVPSTQPAETEESANQMWDRALGKAAEPEQAFTPLSQAESAPLSLALKPIGLVVTTEDMPETRLRIHAYLSAQSLRAVPVEIPTFQLWGLENSFKALRIAGITRQQVQSLRQLLSSSVSTELIPLENEAPSGPTSTTQPAEPGWSSLLEQAAAETKVNLLIFLEQASNPPEATEPAEPTEISTQPTTQPGDMDELEPAPMP